MIKLRLFSLQVFLLFLLCGCIQTLHKTPISRDVDYLPTQTNIPDFTEPPVKVDHKDQKPSQIDHLVVENNIESPAPEHINKIENNIAENSLHEKKIQPVLDEALVFCRAAQDFWQKGELENALEALDHAYALILGIETDDTAKLTQQKEDLRFMIAKRILEIYASRNIVINGNYNAIPLVMNKHCPERNRPIYPKKVKKIFSLNPISDRESIAPQIVSALKEAGLPVELSWLPVD